MRIVLASGSPRRREILSRLGFTFTVHPSDCPEDDVSESVCEMVQSLAERKGFSVADSETNALIISCDTLVALNGTPLGKPSDRQDAIRMLTRLSGNTHEVLSGICLINTKSGRHLTDYDRTLVRFRPMTSAEISSYVDSGEPMDKAGSYAIQGKASAFVEEYIGSRDNIIGFPTEKFLDMLNKIL